MCHRYADCKVTTAGETKLLVASAITYSTTLRPKPRTWEEFRDTRTTLAKVDAFASSFAWGPIPVPVASSVSDAADSQSSRDPARSQSLVRLPAQATFRDNMEESASDSGDSSDSGSSPSSSSSATALLTPSVECFSENVDADSPINWFAVEVRTRAHLLVQITPEGNRLSLCRKKPFAAATHSGAGKVEMAAFPGGICDLCIRQCDPALAADLLAAISFANRMGNPP